MAPPDLNTMPTSPGPTAPHSPSTPSRRPSQMTGTPLLPGIHTSGFSQQDDTNIPMRHPRPLTPAELHLQLEKEQEAVVNKLARELSALRAQHSASAASNASSTASSSLDPASAPADMPPPLYGMYRRHRSSSSVSTRSHGAGPGAGASQASVERARDAAGMRSRDGSLVAGVVQGMGRAGGPSAGASPGLVGLGMGEQYFGGRQRRESGASLGGRLEEMERARAVLEGARRENEGLVVRVRELEGLLRARGDGKGGSGGAG